MFDKAYEPVRFASVFFKQEGGNWLVSNDSDFSTSTVFSNVFGYYFGVYTGGLQDSSIDYYWYTDSGLNEDGLKPIGTDYLYPTVTIYLDDQYGGGDRDFNDMVVAGTDAAPAPVPEPATLLLLGTGLMGLAGAGRKKRLDK